MTPNQSRSSTRSSSASRPRSKCTPAHVRTALAQLSAKGYNFLASLHGCDYYPEEPRLGVLYELLDMREVDRITVKARVPIDAPAIESVVDMFPGADFPEREVYDMFGVVFDRPSGSAPDPDAGGLRGLPAAARLPGRRRAGPVHLQRRAVLRQTWHVERLPPARGVDHDVDRAGRAGPTRTSC